MIENPLYIENGTFYLIGPQADVNGEPNPDFKKYADKLLAKGYKVLNPQVDCFCKGTAVKCSYLVMCDYMITLPGTMDDSWGKNQMVIARALCKEIIPAEGFERWESRKNESKKPAL